MGVTAAEVDTAIAVVTTDQRIERSARSVGMRQRCPCYFTLLV